ncbi:hypothetical protein [Haladaptatus sp. NG-SE-30]
MADDPRSRYPREELVEDARTLAETLEDAHPDPYTNHGGRVQFHRRLEESIRAIPEDGESIEDFYERIARFVARIRDGHTKVRPLDSIEDEVEGRSPLGFRVVGTELYVDSVYDDQHADLLGGRLAAVDGESVATLRERLSSLTSAENVYGDSTKLAKTLEAMDSLTHLLGTPKTALPTRIEMHDGTTVERNLNPVEAEDPVSTLETTVEYPNTNGEPAYRFLDADRSTALLALPNMLDHRETHELLAALEHESAERQARRTYERVVSEPVPKDHEEMIAAIPSAAAVLFELAEEMATAGTETLVVDTRDNGGGTSLLTILLVYVLYGEDGIAKANEERVSIPKDSALYRRNFGEEGPIGETENPAGFDFDEYFEKQASDHDEALPEFIEHIPTLASEFDIGEYEGYYRPETVVVVTSASTYSAGAEPAFVLSRLGASVVGVPPSQAPNVPRDLLEDELPNTGLEFTVSFRHVEFCPDEVGDVFTPDVELTPFQFEDFDRAGDAGIRLALAHTDDDIAR